MLLQPYSPMTVRFFVLQAHYRGTIDFSNEALQAAEKGLQKLFKGIETLKKLKPADLSTVDINGLRDKCYEALNDDMNSPVLLSQLFEGVKYINSVNDGTEKLNSADLGSLKELFKIFVFDILGLKDETEDKGNEKLTDNLMNIIINLRQDAKARKDFGTSDRIRKDLKNAGVILKDKKDGVEWEIE